MTPEVTLRTATAADAGFIAEMLAEAASWDRPPHEAPPALADLLAEPRVADYIEDWGRSGDAGVIAAIGDRPVGACWMRCFTADHPGYGFLGADVPGIGLAVVPESRGSGTGRRLLEALIEAADERGAGVIGLSVAEANSAARALYEHFGFVVVGREGGSLTMRLDLVSDATHDL